MALIWEQIYDDEKRIKGMGGSGSAGWDRIQLIWINGSERIGYKRD